MNGALLGAVRSSDSLAAITFIDIAVIVVLARLAGNAMRWFRQPAVIGEIIVGILLGPTLLGAFPGQLTNHLFPVDVRPYLSDIAQIGLVIFMFLVGLEVDAKLLRGRARLAATVSLSSIAVPFGLGIAIAFSLHGSHHLVPDPAHLSEIRNVHLLPFALFIGASMSVTVFPVLARILAERGLYRIPVGAITLACAAVDDVAAWTLLAVVLAVVSGGGAAHVVLVIVETAAFFAGIMIVVRPLLRWAVTHFHRDEGLAPELMVIVLAGILASSYVTAEIGIHQIFGAFIFGVAMPRDGTAQFVSEVVERLESVALILLLPVYFVVTGFSVNVRTISARGVGQLGLILVAAIGGKFLGAAFGARINGLPGRRAATVGVLMNTRGLTELVILNVGLSKGVLDMQLFTLLVVMAIVTTVMTEPLLRLVYPDRLLAADVADVERQDAGRGGYRVLVYVGDLVADAPILGLAASMFDRGSMERVNVSHFVLRRKHRVSGMAGDLAEMADLLDQLGRLCSAQGGDRLHAGALFTDDIERELRDQVARLDIDCLVVGLGASDALVTSLLSVPPADVVVARRLPETTTQLVAMTDDSDDAPAVVEVAARLAIAQGLPLVLVAASRGGQRRLGQCAERFRALLPAGVQVVAAVDPEHSTNHGTLLVSGAEMADAPVRVRSGEEAARIGWEERVNRVDDPEAGVDWSFLVTKIADYELLRPLGQGVTGQFYLAQPPTRLGLNTGQVAVKVVRGPIGADPFKRVVNELRIFATTDSEYLVTLFDAGQEEGTLYYAMEYYPAGSLAAPAQALDGPTVCTALADAARGAHALHERGVAHRNIKPGNVLLAAGGRGRLSDLGLAKFMTPGQTVTKSGSVGEVEYLEPASVRGERATRATDIWALGATLHRVLTGRPIYPGLTGTDVLADLRRVLNERPTVDPNLPGGVAALVTDCLAADPADRPATALDVANRLDEIGVRPW